MTSATQLWLIDVVAAFVVGAAVSVGVTMVLCLLWGMLSGTWKRERNERLLQRFLLNHMAAATHVRVQAGDLLFIKCRNFSHLEAAEILDMVQARCPVPVRVVVIGPDADVSVVSPLPQGK